ncbi:MAG: DUF4342 domain-containing protein [Cyanobacteria bacterium J06634_6]
MQKDTPADSFVDNADAALPISYGVAAAKEQKTGFVVENFNISGDTLMSQIDTLIRQGNVHRIAIENSEGHTLLSVPTHRSALDTKVVAIPSLEAKAIKVISAIVEYPRVIVERFA